MGFGDKGLPAGVRLGESQSSQPSRKLGDLMIDRLPPQSQARLTHDEVRELLRAHLRWLHAKGLQPFDVMEHVQLYTPLPSPLP